MFNRFVRFIGSLSPTQWSLLLAGVLSAEIAVIAALIWRL